MILTKSKKYNVPSKWLTAILMQESGYKLEAKRKKCGLDAKREKTESCVVTDYGIAQIHWKNLERYKLDKVKLTTDLDYSVDAGARILAEKRKFQLREPATWMCRYNAGTASFEKIKDNCLNYKDKIQRYL